MGSKSHLYNNWLHFFLVKSNPITIDFLIHGLNNEASIVSSYSARLQTVWLARKQSTLTLEEIDQSLRIKFLFVPTTLGVKLELDCHLMRVHSGLVSQATAC